jgi:hypothetical protein
MIICRIEIRGDHENSLVLNQLLKLLVACYVVAASAYLIYKLFTLSQQPHPSSKEWAAIFINFIIIFVLTRQLLRLNNKKFILITDEIVKYRLHFPWTLQLNWKKIKKIQFGYTSVRFITKSEKKYRFYFSKATEDEKTNLREALTSVALKYDIEFMQPI